MTLVHDHTNRCAATGFVSGKSNHTQKSTERRVPQLSFAQIDAERKRRGITITQLCRNASLCRGTYYAIQRRGYQPQRRSLIRLARALQSSKTAAAPELVGGLYRAALCTFAAELGADVKLALQAKSLSNFDAGNRAAGMARRLAFYVTVNAFDVPRPEVARAVGYSKQAASKALKEIEDARGEDAVLNALIMRVGELLTGRDLT